MLNVLLGPLLGQPAVKVFRPSGAPMGSRPE
jgi:hypothetical protein